MRRLKIGAPLLGAAVIAVLAPALICLRWFSTPPVTLIPEQPYVVAVHGNDATFDLEFSPDVRYLIVIGSLGSAMRRYEIDCSARPIAATRCVPLTAFLTPRTNDRGPITRGTPVLNDGSAGELGPRPPTTDGRSASTPLADRSFCLHVTDGSLDDPKQYATIHARRIADGREVRVYLDDQQSVRELAPGIVESVISILDKEVIPRFRSFVGSYRDVDHDGRFSVLLSPWLGHLQGGRTSVGGFVRGSDFQAWLDPPFSNRCDMMYINSAAIPGPHLRTLLIHEYAHAVCFSRRSAGSSRLPRFPDEEDWLNEAVAHCAESLLDGGWSNLDYRIARFLDDPAAFPLVVDDYYRAGLWRCHGCRGATYLFLRHCVERFGPEVITRLVENSARGTHNVELATGCPFPALFRDWTLSMCRNNAGARPIEDALEPSAGPKVDAEPGLGNGAPSNGFVAGRLNSDGDKSPSAAFVFVPLDLFGSVGTNWGLAGPNVQQWDIDALPMRLQLIGTAAAFAELHASAQTTARRIRIKAEAGTKMQISVVRLAANEPQIDVAASWAEDRSNVRPLQVAVHVARGDGLTIERISAEQNAGEIRESVSFARQALASLERTVKSRQGACWPTASRVFDLPAKSFAAPQVPVTIKVVAVDRTGRRCAGWARIKAGLPMAVTGRLAQSR